MSNHGRDYDKTMALLKSVATEYSAGEHTWTRCRHCLAVHYLDRAEVRASLKVFIMALESCDRDYGKK